MLKPPPARKDTQIPVSPNSEIPDSLLEGEETERLTRMKVVAEIEAARAQARKANADARNAETEYDKAQKRRFYEKLISTAQGTAALALITIAFQIFQFGYTARENRAAAEDAQWKDVVKSLSFEPGAPSVSSVTNLATFYRSPRYAANAKALAAAILPVIQNHDAFDRAFINLAHETAWGDEGNLYTVARAVTDRYLNDIDHARDKYGNSIPAGANQKLSDFLATKQDDLADKAADEATMTGIQTAIDEAKLREWEIDSYTTFIRAYWAKHGTKPPATLLSKLNVGDDAPYAASIQKILFRYDDAKPINFARFDFSNASLEDSLLIDADLSGADLSGANFAGATLTGANLSNVTSFDRSNWTGATWWNAGKISSELCGYLSLNDAPQDLGDRQTALRKCPR